MKRWLLLGGMLALGGCGSGGGGGGGDGNAPQPAPLPPLGLTINCAPVELVTSETSQCAASVEGTGETPDWEVSGGAIDAGTGLFTAPDSPGTVTITATVRDSGRSASDSVEITVQHRPLSLTIDCTPVELHTSETSQCTASVEGTDEAPEWEVSSGTIDAGTGLFVAPQSAGTVTITATVREQDRSISESIEITVRRRPLTVSGDPNVRDSRTGRTLLHAAAMANSPKLIAALAAAGADVEARDRNGITALHAAAALNGVAAIAALLDAGANFEARDYDGNTPLQYSVARSHGLAVAEEAVAALLQAGADPNVYSEYGLTPLYSLILAAESNAPGAMATLVALLEAGADPNARIRGGGTPLHWATRGNGPAVTAMLLEAGADPNARNDRGWTPLRSWVAVGEHPAIMAALLEAGADIETRVDDGATLLHLAAERDRPATVVALLEAGVGLNMRDDDGRTPLHAAAASTASGRPVASAAAIVVLLEAGADPNARDDRGYTALQLAPAGSTGLMTALLEAHAGRTVLDPNARDAFGYTSLHAAARANSPTLIAALVEAGADLDALDNDGITPLLLAAGASRNSGANTPPPTYSPAAIAALAEAGADLEVGIRDAGLTALLVAAIFGETAVIAALLEAGADLEARDPNGWTALRIALERGNTAAIVVLAEAWADLEAGDSGEFAAVLALVLATGNPAALADAGVDLNVRDIDGRTPLHWAARQRNTAMIATLADAGADVNAQDRDGRTALHEAVTRGNSATIAALAAAGADLEARYRGLTALQLAADRGKPVAIAALLEAGAELEARDTSGRTALYLAANRDIPGYSIGSSTPAAIAALLEAGADPDAFDILGSTPLQAAASAGNQAAMATLLAVGANWTSGPDADPAEVNARIVAVELFQGPMVWRWELVESNAAGSGVHEGRMADHAKALLHRAAAVAVRIGSETPDPIPELSVSLSDADGGAWPVEADLVWDPNIVSVPGNSESGLWETEYVYELPAEWADSGHRAIFSIDPYNRLEETDKSDNTATLTMDGYAVPVFDVTFVPIVFSGDPPGIDTDTYMAVIGDLVPVGGYRAEVGRLLDLSDRNLGASNTELSKRTALDELLHRWNAEAGENEYYHGLLSTAELSFGFGGQAYKPGNVAVSDAIYVRCQAERTFCGGGTHAHELGHNLDLSHAPGNCEETEPLDLDFPYPDAGVGPRRGWVASREEFVNSGGDNLYRDMMSYCSPQFVSDYNYNKMVNHRLGDIAVPPDESGRLGPSLEIGPIPSVSPSMISRATPTLWNGPPPGAATPSDASGPGVAVTDAVDEVGPTSLAFAGAVDAYGLWSIGQIDASIQPPRSPSTGGEYFFALWDSFQREIYQEPIAMLSTAHGEASRSWAVRVPVTEQPPAFLVILDAQGTPLFIESIEVPANVLLEN